MSAAARVPAAPAAISAGAVPTIPTQSRPMNTASGRTTSTARRRAMRAAPRTSMIAKASASAIRMALPRGPGLVRLIAIRTRPTVKAPFGVIEESARSSAQQGDEVAGRDAIEHGREQHLQHLVERVVDQPRKHRGIHETLPAFEEQCDQEGRS